MKKIFQWVFAAILICSMTAMVTSCTDDNNSSSGGGSITPLDPKVDLMTVKVTADIPTAVLSSFDDTSMGAALVRRLPKTTTGIEANTKMILIKGEDIIGRPLTEWIETAKIYLQGGYVAIEKPHNAHLVHLLEQMADKMAQAEQELLTGDDGSGITITVTPPANEVKRTSIHAERLKARVDNLRKMGSRATDAEAAPVAEMVILARDCYYTREPYGEKKIVVQTTAKDGSTKSETKTMKSVYCKLSSGIMADGAALWLNNRGLAAKERKAAAHQLLGSRASGEGAINELMSASEEHTYQNNLYAIVLCQDYDGTPDEVAEHTDAYKETVRIWGVHNMTSVKDFYCIEQKTIAAVGGQKEGSIAYIIEAGRWGAETLYQGPYKENDWTKLATDDVNDFDYWFYGAWYNKGSFKMNLSGNGDIKLEDAVPVTDNNNVSTSIAVGESHSETNTIGATLNAVISQMPGLNIGGNYSHGWTDGTSFTMTTTENAKELKCVKNTEGNRVAWEYSCGKDMMSGDDDEHTLAPDALTNDVDIDNQACWSVAKPDGAYTVEIYHQYEMASLIYNDGDKEMRSVKLSENEDDCKVNYTIAIPNRAKQVWYMDVTFPEIGQAGYEEVKTKLTEALQRQFSNIYQPTLELADQTADSENTIGYLVGASKQMLLNENAQQTLKEYALTYNISQFTLKWYTLEGNHKQYEMTVTTK